MQLLSVESVDTLNCLTKLVDKYPEASELFKFHFDAKMQIAVQNTCGRWKKISGRPAPALVAREPSSGAPKLLGFPAKKTCGGMDTRLAKKRV
jgi:hypothetical protein